jgi:quercetin dioxygenase-like cupin family protein
LTNEPGHRAGLFLWRHRSTRGGPDARARHLVSYGKREEIMTGTAKATVFIDNERVIVTEYRFAPGANTGWHRHGHDYVIVPLMDGKLKLVTKDGESFAEMKKGAPYFRKEGVEHDVINANDGEYAFIEIELK